MSGGARKHWWHAPQNPAATHYVYENDRVKGGTRFTFLAISLEMPRRCTVTEPMYLEPLINWTRFTERQVRNHLDALEDLQEVSRHRVAGTKLVRYEMVHLAGPLFVAPREQREGSLISGSRRQHPEIRPEKISGSHAHDPEIFSGSAGRDPLITSTTDLRSTYVPTPSRSPDAAAAVLNMHAAIDRWRDRWSGFHGEEWPCNFVFERDAEVFLDLVQRHRFPADATLDELVELVWTVRPDANPTSERSYIANSDHNIRIVRHLVDKAPDIAAQELRRRRSAQAATVAAVDVVDNDRVAAEILRDRQRYEDLDRKIRPRAYEGKSA